MYITMILHVLGWETDTVIVAWLPGDAGDVTDTSFTFAAADAGTTSASRATRTSRPLRTTNLRLDDAAQSHRNRVVAMGRPA